VDKHLLYLTSNHLAAYYWASGNLSDSHMFTNDAEGWEAFAAYLSNKPGTRVYLLADLIEEDFHRELLPHVAGQARKNLHQRRLSQHYRDTPYRHMAFQGRDKTGRKDDQLLFSGLTNATLLKPWADVILAQKLPFVGIYSPALLGVDIIKQLHLDDDHLLLVTLLPGGLRQSYYQKHTLKFSRLAPAESNRTNFAGTVATETAKTLQFLANSRLLPRGAATHLVIFTQGLEIPQLQATCPDTPTLRHTFLAIDDVTLSPKFRHISFPLKSSDLLFLGLLNQKAPAHHYAPSDHMRIYHLWQTRLGLYGLSVVTLLAGLCWAGWGALNILEYREQTDQMNADNKAAEVRYNVTQFDMPKTSVSAQTMKSVVNITDMIRQNNPSPTTLIETLSHVLDRLPNINIDRLEWRVDETNPSSIDPNNAEAQADAQPPIEGSSPSAILVGVPTKPFQTLLVEGQVLLFRHNYRDALQNFQQLTAELSKNSQLHVEVTRSPLDIRPTANLEEKVGDEYVAANVKFGLKLVWVP